jgi:Domain of unknown function (DUF4276)
VIVVVVEGRGEEEALPILVRRIMASREKYADIETHRVKRQRVVKEGELEKAVEFAALGADCSGVLVVLDSDDDCAATEGPDLRRRAVSQVGHKPIGFVFAVSEFEAWILAGIEGARGHRGIGQDATWLGDPDAVRSPKSRLERLMGGRSYLETDDQAAFAALLDVDLAQTRSRSFRKFISELDHILEPL